jgi:hypothetical protein
MFAFITNAVVSSPRLYGCSCASPSPREKFREATAVLIGEIVEVCVSDGEPKFFPWSVKFRILKQWKGKKTKETTLRISYDIPGMCGDMPLDTGNRYLIYARSEAGVLVTHSDCGPNLRVEHAADEIRQLNRVWFRIRYRLPL